MAKHLRQGKWAEQKACDYLQSHGLRLRQRNFRCRYGEIDLIMTDGECLTFVEVRYRRSTEFGHPADTVDYRKQSKLKTTAACYLRDYGPPDTQCRFDVFAISGSADEIEIEWIKDAFQVA